MPLTNSLKRKSLLILVSSDKKCVTFMMRNYSKGSITLISIRWKLRCYLSIISFIGTYPKYLKSQSLEFLVSTLIGSGIMTTRKSSVCSKKNKESLSLLKKAKNHLFTVTKSKNPSTALFSTNLTKTANLNPKFSITSAKKSIRPYNTSSSKTTSRANIILEKKSFNSTSLTPKRPTTKILNLKS